MDTRGLLIHCHTNESFNIDADTNLYKQIVDEMSDRAGDFMPHSCWTKVNLDDSEYTEIPSKSDASKNAMRVLEKNQTLTAMLECWLGCDENNASIDCETGGIPNESKVFELEEFLKGLGDLSFFNEFKNSSSYKITPDFMTIQEISMINSLTKNSHELKILEIGGGYGRLAEAVLNVYKGVKYVLADSVPISLMYAYLFLKKNLPNHRIGLFFDNPSANPLDYDCYIIPAWHLESVCTENSIDFNLFVNIYSMQEMSQWHVDYYLDFFNRFGADRALIYLNNSKEYIFKGDCNYPKQWQLLYRNNSPFSMTLNSPTEIFVKGDSDYTHLNNLVTAPYNNSLYISFLNSSGRYSRQFIKILAAYVDLVKESKEVYIYGTGDVATYWGTIMTRYSIDLNCKGFVVSDGQLKKDVFFGHNVYYLSEVNITEKTVFLIALCPTYAREVCESLQKRGLPIISWVIERI